MDTISPLLVALSLVATFFVPLPATAQSESSLTPSQQAEKARLEKHAKGLQKSVLFEVLAGGAIKGALTGSATKAAAAVATGTVTKGGAEVAKEKTAAYKKAKKLKFSKDADSPPEQTGGSAGGAMK